MLHVLLIMTARESGGAEAYVQRLVHETRDRCVFTVVMSNHRALNSLAESIHQDSMRVVRFNFDALGGLPVIIRRLIRLAQQHDVIHLNSNHPGSRLGIALAFALSHLPQPLVCVEHSVTPMDSIVVPRYLRRFLPYAFKASRAHVAKIVAVSGENAQRLQHDYGIPPGIITVVHNGIPMPPASTVLDAHSMRNELHLSPHTKIIAVIARLSVAKGHRYLVQAAPTIAAQIPEAHFVFAGEGDEQHKLIEEINSSGLANRFHLLGRRSDVDLLLSQSDVFVLPSLAEGFSLSIIEALAHGLPVIATTVGGATEVIQHGVNGFLVPPANASLLAQAVIQALQLTADDREKMRLAALKSAQQFTASIMANKTIAVYMAAVQQRRAHSNP